MASFTVTTLDTSPETLLDGEVGYITLFGELVVASGDAITGEGDVDLFVRGAATTTDKSFNSSVFDFGGTTVDVFVDAPGSLLSAGGAVLDLNASLAIEIVNEGRIIGETTGIDARSNDGAAVIALSNNGFINAATAVTLNSGSTGTFIANTGVISSSGVAVSAQSTFGVELSNSGTIMSTGSIAVLTSDGDDVVTNTGTIQGRIRLGDGDDLFLGQFGIQEDHRFIDLGTGDDTFVGGAGGEFINGGNGADEILAGGGNDSILGNNDGADNLYDGGDGIDLVSYTAAGFSVVVNLAMGTASGGFLGADQLVSIEKVATGIGDDTITGSSDDNWIRTLSGNDRIDAEGGNDRVRGGLDNDTLLGGDGNDRLFGEEDNDRLLGENGNDLLVGGLGADAMTGGAGNDHFVLRDLADSGTGGGTRDRITDFQQGFDKLDVSSIDANLGIAQDSAFAFIGVNAFSGTVGELRYRNTATLTIVEMDQDGDGVADSSVRLDGVITMAGSDFIL